MPATDAREGSGDAVGKVLVLFERVLILFVRVLILLVRVLILLVRVPILFVRVLILLVRVLILLVRIPILLVRVPIVTELEHLEYCAGVPRVRPTHLIGDVKKPVVVERDAADPGPRVHSRSVTRELDEAACTAPHGGWRTAE